MFVVTSKAFGAMRQQECEISLFTIARMYLMTYVTTFGPEIGSSFTICLSHLMSSHLRVYPPNFGPILWRWGRL